MLVVVLAHAPHPGLAAGQLGGIVAAQGLAGGDAGVAEGVAAGLAAVAAQAGLHDVAAGPAGARGGPGGGLPGDEVVAAEALQLGPLDADDELAQELRVPLVRVRGQQHVRLLEGEQVDDELAQQRRVADLVVQRDRVAGRGHAVALLGQRRHPVDDGVAQRLDRQPVREPVQRQQQVEGHLAAAREDVVELARVGPRQEELERGHVLGGQGQLLREPFGEGARERGGKEGRVVRQEVAVDEERRFGAADEDGGDDGESLELSPGGSRQSPLAAFLRQGATHRSENGRLLFARAAPLSANGVRARGLSTSVAMIRSSRKARPAAVDAPCIVVDAA